MTAATLPPSMSNEFQLIGNEVRRGRASQSSLTALFFRNSVRIDRTYGECRINGYERRHGGAKRMISGWIVSLPDSLNSSARPFAGSSRQG